MQRLYALILTLLSQTVSSTLRIKRIVLDALLKDYSKFYPKPERVYERMEYELPEDHKRPEVDPRRDASARFPFAEFKQVASEVVKMGEDDGGIELLRSKARSFFPRLEPANNLGQQRKVESSPRGLIGDCVSGGDVCEPGSSTCCDGKTCAELSDTGVSFCVSTGAW